MKTKPPRFYVLASAAIARQRRTQCVVVLKSGGQFPDTLSAQELLPGWQMGGCHWPPFVGTLFVAFVRCILCHWFAIDCQRETHFIFCFCGEILKSGLLRLTTWSDILSCSHYLDFLVLGHQRFDDLIVRRWTLSRIFSGVGVKQGQKSKTSKTLDTYHGLFMQL